jgi:hypothetical protein|nr:MAG TPA: hypothetical protein [Caudoviricetes sp.]
MNIYKKKYAIYGMIEQSCVFPMGAGHIRVDFRHGSLTTAGVVPATFSTSNPVIQQAVENSPKFKSGIIKMVESIVVKEVATVSATKGTETPEVGDTVNAAKNREGEETSYPDVKNSQQAKDVLMAEPYSIPLAELGNKAAIQAKAEELGVSFPNWN